MKSSSDSAIFLSMPDEYDLRSFSAAFTFVSNSLYSFSSAFLELSFENVSWRIRAFANRFTAFPAYFPANSS